MFFFFHQKISFLSSRNVPYTNPHSQCFKENLKIASFKLQLKNKKICALTSEKDRLKCNELFAQNMEHLQIAFRALDKYQNDTNTAFQADTSNHSSENL